MKAQKNLSIRNLNGEEKDDEELFMKSNDDCFSYLELTRLFQFKLRQKERMTQKIVTY